MATRLEVLQAIPVTEPADFREFLRGLPDIPSKGDRDAWRDLFETLEGLEADGLVEVERANAGGAIESLILTEEGKEMVRNERG